MDDLERQIKRLIAARSSETLATYWAGHFPTISPAGEKPSKSVEDVADFGTVAAQLKDLAREKAKELFNDPRNKGKQIPPPIITQLSPAKGIRKIVFWEGLFLLHKASHVVSCAELGVRRGVKTWSLCDAYQGALFGAKAICYLLGIAFPEYESKTMMLDVWPDDPSKKSGSFDEKPFIQFTRWPFLFQHQHIWRVFQRLLRVSRIITWPNGYTRTLADLDHGEFAYQRNQIQYTNGAWIFDDLFAPDIDPSFGNHPTDLQEALEYKMEGDFSVALSLAILRLGYLLVEELTQNTGLLNDEKELVRSQFTPDKHPLYLLAHP